LIAFALAGILEELTVWMWSSVEQNDEEMMGTATIVIGLYNFFRRLN
jgi:hypothetical protein